MKILSLTVLYILLVFIITTAGLLLGNEQILYLILLFLGLTALAFQKFFHKNPIRNLGYKWPSAAWIIYAVVYSLSAILLIAVLDFLTGWTQLQSQEAIRSSINFTVKESLPMVILLFVLLQWILTTLINLITEELTFRGYILTRLQKLGTWKAVLFSSLLFGLWHVPVSILIIKSGWLRVILYAVNISLLGIGFGWLFIRSGSLIPPCIAHGLWNALEYTFWGMGNHTGVFVGSQRVLFDPEEGAAGTIILLIFAVVFMIKLGKLKLKK